MKNKYFDLVDQTFDFPQDEFRTEEGELYFHDIPLMEIIKQYGTPLKITYLPKITSQIQRAKRMFNVAIAKTAKENGKGIIIMKVLGEGSINTPEGRKRSTIAVTRMPYKDVMIVGFEAKQHIDEFLENVAEGLAAK